MEVVEWWCVLKFGGVLELWKLSWWLGRVRACLSENWVKALKSWWSTRWNFGGTGELSINHSILHAPERPYQQFLRKGDYFLHFTATFQPSSGLRQANFQIGYGRQIDKKLKWFPSSQLFLSFLLGTNRKILCAFWLTMENFIGSCSQYQKLNHLNWPIQNGN